MLILVRHAMPAFAEHVPPEDWPLSDEGRAAAQALTATLPADSVLVASAERKALETLPGATPDSRFNEVRRENEPWNGDFRELRRSYVEGARHPGWEPQAEVAARFEAGVQLHLARAAGRPLAIATHGMAMTVWLTWRGDVTDPGEFWAALRFPEAVPVSSAPR